MSKPALGLGLGSHTVGRPKTLEVFCAASGVVGAQQQKSEAVAGPASLAHASGRLWLRGLISGKVFQLSWQEVLCTIDVVAAILRGLGKVNDRLPAML